MTEQSTNQRDKMFAKREEQKSDTRKWGKSQKESSTGA